MHSSLRLTIVSTNQQDVKLGLPSRCAGCLVHTGEIQWLHSPVQSARKFSMVLGACLPYSPITTRPGGTGHSVSALVALWKL